VKQSSLNNQNEYEAAKNGIEFAQACIKTAKATYTSQHHKLVVAFRRNALKKDDFDAQVITLKNAVETDTIHWHAYVQKLTELVTNYEKSYQSSLTMNRSDSSSRQKRAHEDTDTRSTTSQGVPSTVLTNVKAFINNVENDEDTNNQVTKRGRFLPVDNKQEISEEDSDLSTSLSNSSDDEDSPSRSHDRLSASQYNIHGDLKRPLLGFTSETTKNGKKSQGQRKNENDTTSSNLEGLNKRQRSRLRKRERKYGVVKNDIQPSQVQSQCDATVNTDPLQLSLLTPFPSTPNFVSFTSRTNQITVRVPLPHVNEIAAKQIVYLHDEGSLVRWNDVLWRTLCYFHVQDLGNIGVNRADHIPCVENLIRTQNKINVYLDSYGYYHTIGTLFELEKDLASLFQKQNYCDLLLGPVYKQPKIYELFHYPSTLTTPNTGGHILNVRTSDVLKFLDEFMTKQHCWNSANDINVEQFLLFMASKLNITNINELGVRIKNPYLPRTCIKAVQANQRKGMELAREQTAEALKLLAQQETAKTLRLIQEKFDIKSPLDTSSSSAKNEKESKLTVVERQRYQYLTMEPLDVMDDLIDICRVLFKGKPCFKKMYQVLKFIRDDSVLRNLFQISICLGRFALPEEEKRTNYNNSKSSPIQQQEKTSKKTYFPSSATSSDSSSSETSENEKDSKEKKPIVDDRVRPTEENVIEAFKEQISSLETITFQLLERIEQRLCEKFHFERFYELGRGTFVQFLKQNEYLFHEKIDNIQFSFYSDQELLKKKMMVIDMNKTSVSLQEIHQLIFEFLENNNNQKQISEQQEKFYEFLICYHYHVDTFTSLGHGTFHNVLSKLKQMKKPITVGGKRAISYECTMLDEDNCIFKKPERNSFLEDLQEKAILSLINCPLLENLYEYSQWNILYRSSLGDLKDFLLKYIGKQITFRNNSVISFDVCAIEIESSTLLKLSTTSTLDTFKQSLYNYNVIQSSGHLVSLLTQYCSLKNAPLALLTNIIETFMSKTIINDRQTKQLYEFLVKLLTRMPFLLTCNIIMRLFLEPLIKLEGSVLKVRECLWNECLNENSGYNSRIRFVKFGTWLGISEWSNDNIVQSTNMTQQVVEKPQTSISISRTVVEPKIENTSLLSTKSSFPSNVLVKQDLISDKMIDNSMEKCHSLIERIRREKFGIGIELSSEGQQLTDALKALVGRSLDRLSKELYNTDMHFVLELIQNADDNRYTNLELSVKNGVYDVPSLVFVVEQNSITLYNNEDGFREENIEALCDVGKSTKGKHKQGYIGQKGIGFKSIFTVCDRPEVRSNGYSIYFDALSGPIGYILPNWMMISEINEENWTTRIRLPLKSESEMQKHKARSLTSSFNDIHPSLLLFLNRLRSITIDNRVTNCKRIYQRIDINDSSIIEIHCHEILSTTRKTTIEKWFVFKRKLTVPNELRPSLDIESTELALAFPLYDNIHEDKTFSLPKQDVCAYLPLRTVPSSRQDILSDSSWNQWLLNEIPQLYNDVLEQFKQQQDATKIDPIQLFLRYLPTNESEIHGLFQFVCRSILRQLRAKSFLPVIIDDNQTIDYRTPSECVLVRDTYIKDVLTPELLKTHLNLYYLSENLIQNIDHRRLLELGVHCLDHNQLIDVIKRLFSSSSSSKTIELFANNKHMLAKWFCCLYRCLNDLTLKEEENIFKHVQSLPIIPLTNGKWTSLSTTVVFFKHYQQQTDIAIENDLIEQDLNILDNELFQTISNDPVAVTQVQTVLERLGVKRFVTKDIIEQHIYPIFVNDLLWKEKSCHLLVAYVIYIYDFWCKQQQIDMKYLKTIIQLATTNQLTIEQFNNPLKKSIHFTKTYGNRYDLKQDYPNYEWLLLNDVYIEQLQYEKMIMKEKQKISIQDRMKLHRFMNELGVKDFLHIEQTSIKNIHYKQDLKLSLLWSVRCEDILPSKEEEYNPYASMGGEEANNIDEYVPMKEDEQITDVYTIQDWTCKQFSSLISTKSIIINKRLFEALEENWMSFYDAYKVAYLYKNNSTNDIDEENGLKLREYDSTFYSHLKTDSWLPTIQTEFKTMDNSDTYETSSIETIVKHELHSPNKVYVKTQLIEKLYHQHVPYVYADVNESSLFTTDLGLIHSVKPSDVVAMLLRWSDPTINETDCKHGLKHALFHTSLSHIRYVYEYLYRNMEEDELKQLIDEKPIIFVPVQSAKSSIKTLNNNAIVRGLFVHKSEVCWHDPSYMFSKYRPSFSLFENNDNEFCRFILKPFYSDLQHLFLNIFQISTSPTIEEYIALLDYISYHNNNHPTKAIIQDAFSIYRYVGQRCSSTRSELIEQNDETSKDDMLEQEEEMDTSDSNEVLDATKQRIQDLLSRKTVFPIKSQKWICLEDDPIIIDDNEIASKFDIKRVPFLQLSTNRSNNENQYNELHRDIRAFFNLCNIKKLSDVLVIEHITENLCEAPQIQNFLSPLVPYIQMYMSSRPEFHTAYEWTKTINLQEKLLNIKMYLVGRLDILYRFKHNSLITVLSSEKCCSILTDENILEFYVQRDYNERLREICQYFSRIFVNQITNIPKMNNMNTNLARNLANFMILLNEELKENMFNLESFAKYQHFELHLKQGLIPWSIPRKEIKFQTIQEQSQVDEEKVRILLENVAQNQEQYQVFRKNQRDKRLQQQQEENNMDDIKTTKPVHSWPPAAMSSNICAAVSHPSGPKFIMTESEEGEWLDPSQNNHQHQQIQLSQQSSILDSSIISDIKRPPLLPTPLVSTLNPTQLQSAETTNKQSSLHMDRIQFPFRIASNVVTIEENYENIDYSSTRQFNLKDLTSEIVDNRETTSEFEQIIKNIGKWGEQWVNEYLHARYKSEIEFKQLEFVWVNEMDEQGKPYDFIIKHTDGKVIYIEVKSTISDKRELMPITLNEIQYCCTSDNTANSTYEIYRLYNAGKLEQMFVCRCVCSFNTRLCLKKQSLLKSLLPQIIRISSYHLNIIETENKITVPHKTTKNIEKLRAKVVYKQEKEQDPPGDKTVPPIISCKRNTFNHHVGRRYNHFTEKNVASATWGHQGSKGDYFTIDHHFKNPAWTQSTIETFDLLQCEPKIVEILQNVKIIHPTSAQCRGIPEIRSGRHKILAAETGSGKTLAYLIPIIESLLMMRLQNQTRREVSENAPFALIMAPTLELVMQIQNMLKIFDELDIQTKTLIGINPDKDPLNFSLGQFDILVTTPGILLRILRQDEHFGIKQRLIGANLRHIVIDEADSMLDATFSPVVVEIIRRLEVDVQPINDDKIPAVQLIFVSATMPTSTEENLKELVNIESFDQLTTPALHRIMPHVPQKFYRIGSVQKLNLLLNLVKYDIEKKHSTLIFCNKSPTVQFLKYFFKDQRIEVLTMHGGLTNYIRTKNFESFRNGDNPILCATDIASRGVDTYWVTHVINFDFPRYISDYIHRAGRVGRVGSRNPGKVTSFVTYPSEVELAQKIEVTTRFNRKLQNVNSNIKLLMEKQTEKKQQQQDKNDYRERIKNYCDEIIRSSKLIECDR
ncbi:unnamed protein product, partial [Didymodactylos carnosus]